MLYINNREYDTMALISNETINEIRRSVDIVDIISGYLPLTQKGKNFFGVCPFHDDTNPSMSVSKEKQIYTCFSCGATGNVFRFVMDYENVSFLEAVKIVADHAGIDIQIDTRSSKKNVAHLQPLYDMYELSQKLYQNNINTSQGREARTYLKQREIDDSIIKEFGIGLALHQRDVLTKLFLSKKYSHEDMVKSGLVLKNDYGYLDMYQDRIMFPLWDISGRIVGYSGRLYKTEGNFKYINTRETEIFKKGELLYNYHRAKDEARRLDTVLIMEGFMDVIRAYTIGVKNVVATMGTAVTKEHIILLKRMAKNILLVFDGDSAGAKATYACANELLKVGITPKIVRLEEDLDPDDYIKKYGKERFLRKINHPINVMDFKLSYLKEHRDLTSNEDLARYVQDVLQELSMIEDDVLLELTIKKMSEESSLDESFLRKKLEEIREKKEQKEQKNSQNLPTKEKKKEILNNKYTQAEKNLIYYMLKSPEVIKMYDRKMTYMPTESYRLLARDISYFYKQYHQINEADFITFIGNNQQKMDTLGEILSLPLKEEYTLDEIEDYIAAIRQYNVRYEQRRLKEEMKKITDPLEKAKIAQKIIELKVKGE